MGYETRVDEYMQLLKKLSLLGHFFYVEEAKRKTLELTGESVSIPACKVEYEQEIDLSSFKADGDRIFNRVIKYAKKKDQSSRRFVIQMFNSYDLQCFNIFQFLTRADQTEIVVFMRSCDIINKLPNDLKLFKLLLEVYCALAGTTPSTVTVHFGSLHRYTE